MFKYNLINLCDSTIKNKGEKMNSQQKQEKYIRNMEKKIMTLKKQGASKKEINKLWNQLLNYCLTCDIYI
mgnify:CR=1 FL=1